MSRSARAAGARRALDARGLTRVAVLLAGSGVLLASPLTAMRGAGPTAAGSASAAEAMLQVPPRFRVSVFASGRCCVGHERDCSTCFDVWAHTSWIMPSASTGTSRHFRNSDRS